MLAVSIALASERYVRVAEDDATNAAETVDTDLYRYISMHFTRSIHSEKLHTLTTMIAVVRGSMEKLQRFECLLQFVSEKLTYFAKLV